MIRRLTRRLFSGQRQSTRPDVVSIYDGDAGQSACIDQFEIAPAQRLKSTVEGAAPHQIERHCSAKVGLVLKNVMVWPELSVAATQEGSLIAETLPASQYRVTKLIRFGAFDKAEPVGESDAMTSIGCGYWSNYYHKLVDEIPRLWAISNCEHYRRDIDVWIPSYYHSDFQDLLSALAPSKISFAKVERAARPIQVRRYIHIPMLSNNFCGYLPRAYVKWLHARLRGLSVEENPVTDFSRRVYISRSRADKRQLDNSSDVRELLESFGYETYHPETLSPIQQAKLFERATSIAGPHGAGLTNALYASKARVIEFFPGQPLYHYRWLCETCGHDYRNILSTGPNTHKHDNFRLPLDSLESMIKQGQSDRTPYR
jgi:hypothetical protein